jgi:hypothetical protein
LLGGFLVLAGSEDGKERKALRYDLYANSKKEDLSKDSKGRI